MAKEDGTRFMSLKERLLYDLKYLREEKADIEYHIRKIEERIEDSDKDVIESFELCAQAMRPDRIHGGQDTDRHDTTCEIIRRCEMARAENVNEILELKVRHEKNVALTNAILALPHPYRAVLTAKFIEGKKEACICAEVRLSKSNIYRALNKGVALLLR